MSTYRTGTVSVSNGNAIVTGSGTAWAVALVAGGIFSSAGLAVPIASVDSDTQLTLDYPWPGTTATGAAYAIAMESGEAASVANLNSTLSRILVTLSLAGITPDASGTIAERDALTLAVGDKGFLFLHAEVGVAFAFYRWTGTAWDGPFPVADAAAGGPVSSLTSGTGITVDSTNPAIPVVKMANMATSRVKGRATAGTGSPEDLTLTQVLDMVGSAAQGDILYRGSSAWSRLAKGTALQVLRQNSALTAPEWATGREVLTAARTYYVRSDGSDSNNGLADTAGGAFATKQKALDTVAALDLSIFSVTINVRAGADSSGGISVSGPWTGLGSVTITGDTTTPSNVPIARTSANCVTLSNGARLNMGGFKFSTTTAGSAFIIDSNSVLNLNGKFEIGACATYQMDVKGGGAINISADYTISGGALYHWLGEANGRITCLQRTITLTGTPAFSQQFAYASRTAVLEVHLNTFSGSATGTRYLADSNGVIFTAAGGASYLPGNAAGSVATGGQYA